MSRTDEILKLQADHIRFLTEQNQYLLNENQKLRQLLRDNNIVLPKTATDQATLQRIQSPATKTDTLITDQIIIRMMQYFSGNPEVYALRFHSRKSNISGYSPQCEHLFDPECPKSSGTSQQCSKCIHKQWTKLTITTIRNHILGNNPNGNDVVGIYVMHPDNTVRFIVFDFDDHDGADRRNTTSWIDEVNMLAEVADELNIDYRIERSRSGNGAHFWIFFSESVDASLARSFGNALINLTLQKFKAAKFTFFDRLFPLQDHLSEGQLGNLIALPFQGQAMKQGNSLFIDCEGIPLKQQLQSLFSVHRYSKDEIFNYLRKWKIKDAVPFENKKNHTPWQDKIKLSKTDIDGVLDITIKQQIYINTSNCKSTLVNQLKRFAVYTNAEFYKALRRGFSVKGKSRYIGLSDYDDPYLFLPRGCFDQLIEKLDLSSIDYQIDDKTNSGRPINVEFVGKLTNDQSGLIDQLIDYDQDILV